MWGFGTICIVNSIKSKHSISTISYNIHIHRYMHTHTHTHNEIYVFYCFHFISLKTKAYRSELTKPPGSGKWYPEPHESGAPISCLCGGQEGLSTGELIRSEAKELGVLWSLLGLGQMSAGRKCSM